MESDPSLQDSFSRVWARDTQILPDSTSSLDLQQLTPQQSGSYSCTVRTSLDFARVQHSLAVLRPTKVTPGKVQEVKRVVAGQHVELDCEVEVDSNLRDSLEVTWSRGEDDLGPGSEEWGADSSLTSR